MILFSIVDPEPVLYDGGNPTACNDLHRLAFHAFKIRPKIKPWKIQKKKKNIPAPNLGLFIEWKHKQILHNSRCFLQLRLRWQNIRITVINSDFWHPLRREKSLPASMQDEAEPPDLGTMGCDRVKGLEVLLNCDGKNCSPPRRRSKLIRATARNTARGIFHAQIRLPGYQGDWTINTPTD